ncbi:MAG TPA: CoA transferase [Streptomyces sp.]|nr:CoA transferase [Streptomyces sp.]
MTRQVRARTRPAVAAAVADRLLRQTADALPDGAGPEAERLVVDWAGPVDAALPDERAVQAACGLMHVHGRATGGPAPLAVDYASAVTGVLAALGATALHIGRARGLELREVRTSVAQGALLSVGQYLAAATAVRAPSEPELPAGHAESGLATLVASDGVRVEIETLDPDAWREFWVRLGVAPGTAGRGWLPFQQRFATGACPLPEDLRRAARERTSEELRAAARHAGISLLAVRSDPAPAAYPEPWQLLLNPAPGTGGAEGAGLRPPGADAFLPLAGIRVVESTRRVQGPLAGHVLRMLGADVVRIEPPDGDPMRWLPPLAGDCSARFLALNAGKPVVEADLTTAQDRAGVRALIAEADVFLHNWAPGRAARFGLSAAAMLPAQPSLVYAWASGFGDSFGDRPPTGTDYLAQVHSGLPAAVRPADEPPAPSLMTLTDVLGGLVCAQGVLSALAVRQATGRGSRVQSSLLSAGALVPRPAHRVPFTPLDRPLRTADGHLYLGPGARRLPERVCRLLDTPSVDGVAARFALRTTQDWRARLAEAGLTATPVLTDLAGLTRDAAFRDAVAPPDPFDEYARPCTPWEFV